MKFLDKTYMFLIWLVAHVQTTDHEMSPGGGGGGMVRCRMTAGYIGDFSSATDRKGRHSIIHTENIKHVVESECTVRYAFKIGGNNP